MLPQFLFPETVAREDGVGAEMVLENTTVQITLGITRIITHQSLEVSVWGSPDGERWRPLAAFPPKSHCGTYSTLMDLAIHPDVRYVRAQWKMSRLIREERAPLFEFYVRAEERRKRYGAGAG